MSKSLDLPAAGLRPKCEQTWQGFYGDDWLDWMHQQLHIGDASYFPRRRQVSDGDGERGAGVEVA